MGHVDYDSTLIVGFYCSWLHLLYCISMEQLIFKQVYKKFESLILFINGLLLLAISIIHIVGIQAYHLFDTAHL